MSRFPNCSIEDCESVALWHPVLLVWSVGQNINEDEPTKIRLQANLCAIDKTNMTMDRLVSDSGFSKISKVFKIFGRGRPDFDTMKLDWKSIECKRF